MCPVVIDPFQRRTIIPFLNNVIVGTYPLTCPHHHQKHRPSENSLDNSNNTNFPEAFPFFQKPKTKLWERDKDVSIPFNLSILDDVWRQHVTSTSPLRFP